MAISGTNTLQQDFFRTGIIIKYKLRLFEIAKSAIIDHNKIILRTLRQSLRALREIFFLKKLRTNYFIISILVRNSY